MELKLTYYPWITQTASEQDIRTSVNAFATVAQEILSGAVGEKVGITVLKPLSVPDQVTSISKGDSQIALMNPLGYVFARKRKGSTAEVVAVAKRIIDGKVGTTYYSQLYTTKKTAVRFDGDKKAFENLVGRSIGFGYPYSTSGFLIPALMLHKAGYHPFTTFSRVEFLGAHDVVAKAVYNGQVDVGAGHDGARFDLSRKYGYGDAEDYLPQLLRSDPIQSDPVVVSIGDAKLKELTAAALIKASETTAGKTAIAAFWGDVQGLGPSRPADYDLIASAVDDLGLSENDLLH